MSTAGHRPFQVKMGGVSTKANQRAEEGFGGDDWPAGPRALGVGLLRPSRRGSAGEGAALSSAARRFRAGSSREPREPASLSQPQGEERSLVLFP